MKKISKKEGKRIHYAGGKNLHILDGIAWWAAKDPGAAVVASYEQVRNSQQSRLSSMQAYLQLYSDKDTSPFFYGTAAQASSKRISFNVCKAVTDTAVARISKTKTKALFLTDNGSWSDFRKAKNLTQFSAATLEDCKAQAKARRAMLHACVWDLGAVKVFRDTLRNKVAMECVSPYMLFVDELEAAVSEPRTLYQVAYCSRSVLAEMVKGDKEKVEAVKSAKPFVGAGANSTSSSDLIEVIEAWRLPSGPETGDGRRCLVVSETAIVDEPYEYDSFPFAFFRWGVSALGFYGEGIVSQLVPLQAEINLLLRRIKQAQELVAVPRVFIQNGSNINPSHLNDKIGAIITHDGNTPVFSNPQAVGQELYNHLDYLYRKAFEIPGVSELSATSRKPGGLESGEALRAYQDVETERFAPQAINWEESCLDMSRLAIRVQREIAKEGKATKVFIKGKDFLKTIPWKEIDLEDSRFVLQAYPTSPLPDSPEGRFARVFEMLQTGAIDVDTAWDLVDHPDLKAHSTVKSSGRDDIRYVVERMEEGEFIAPEQYMNLQLGIQFMLALYVRGRAKNMPEEIRQMAKDWIVQAEEILSDMEVAAQNVGPAPLATEMPPAPPPQGQTTLPQ